MYLINGRIDKYSKNESNQTAQNSKEKNPDMCNSLATEYLYVINASLRFSKRKLLLT
jgi:hypothetical protein